MASQNAFERFEATLAARSRHKYLLRTNTPGTSVGGTAALDAGCWVVGVVAAAIGAGG